MHHPTSLRASNNLQFDAVYARYSSHAQDDGTSIEVQIEQCERAAGGKCHHYIDRAKTGRATAHRSELLRLLADADVGKIGRVYVYKFDRLGRGADTHIIARQLDESGAELISATEGTNALARGIQLVVAEDYSRQLANRTRDGLIKRFEQKGFTGGVAPYGYRVETRDGRRVLIVDDNEAAIVRDVAKMYLGETVGLKIIAKRLRARGIATRRGADWCFTSIRALLHNPILTGCARFNVRRMHLDRRTGRRVPRFRTDAEVIERQDESLRILSDEQFAAIRRKMDASANMRGPRAPRGMSRFTGLVFCEAGHLCYRVSSKNRKGNYDYYVCSRHQRYDDCPHCHRVREDRLTAFVKDNFARMFNDSENIISRAVELATEAVKGNRAEADRIKGEIREVEARQARLVELLMDRGISDTAKATISRQVTDAENERTRLQAALEGLRDDANDNTEQLARIVRETFNEARENLATVSTPEEFNRFCERFVGPMTVQADGSIIQKQTPADCAAGVLIKGIAGGGFEPPTSGL